MSNGRFLDILRRMIDNVRTSMRTPNKDLVDPFSVMLHRLNNDLILALAGMSASRDHPDTKPIYDRTTEFAAVASHLFSQQTPQNSIAIMDIFSQKFQSYSAFIARCPRT